MRQRVVFFFLILLFFSANAAFAQDDPGKVVSDVFRFALLIGGLLAFGMIVYGGMMYALAAGNPSGQSDAKDRIWQALLGLVLLLGSVLILNTINPGIRKTEIGKTSLLTAPTDAVCGAEGCTGIDQCTVDGCKPCTLTCNPDAQGNQQICILDPGTGVANCIPCVPFTATGKCKPNEVCKFQGENPVCVARECGDNNEEGDCCPGQPTCDKDCFPRPGENPAWVCENKTGNAPGPGPSPGAPACTPPSTVLNCAIGGPACCPPSYFCGPPGSDGKATCCAPGTHVAPCSGGKSICCGPTDMCVLNGGIPTCEPAPGSGS